MINPSDLRLNNLFSHQGKIKKVFSITQTGVIGVDIDGSSACSCAMEEIETIPVSEKWLFMLGFEQDTDFEDVYIKSYRNQLLYDVMFDGHNWGFQWPSKYVGEITFYHVHEFQNIYRWTTGKELQITTESTECKTCGGNCKPLSINKKTPPKGRVKKIG